jgi:hypothetical protein
VHAAAAAAALLFLSLVPELFSLRLQLSHAPPRLSLRRSGARGERGAADAAILRQGLVSLLLLLLMLLSLFLLLLSLSGEAARPSGEPQQVREH